MHVKQSEKKRELCLLAVDGSILSGAGPLNAELKLTVRESGGNWRAVPLISHLYLIHCNNIDHNCIHLIGFKVVLEL